MPRYLYRCEKCEELFDLFHSITIKHKTCSEINEGCDCDGDLTRIPSFSSYVKKQKSSAGKLTNEFIEKASEELKDQRQSLAGKEYDA